MDQERIGKFIQQLRKENELTQKELAEKLGVTDRAVSKWENGRGLPEVSLMKPLCDALGITINELLSGERIGKEEYQEKSEFNFLNTMDFTDRKIKKKNVLLRVVILVAILLALTAIILVYSLPVTRGYFRPEEDIEFFYIHKTLPICPEGQMPERYGPGEFIDQDITEKIDLERLEELLPLMRISLGSVQAGNHWVGDVTYEVFGYFRNGPRAGYTFCIALGDYNFLQHHARNRSHTIIHPEIWLEIFQELEGWEGESRETFQWETERTFSLFYEGKLYSGKGELLKLPEDVEFQKHVTGISSVPDEERECNFGIEGYPICTWTADGQTYLAVQISHEQAYGIPIG